MPLVQQLLLPQLPARQCHCCDAPHDAAAVLPHTQVLKTYRGCALRTADAVNIMLHTQHRSGKPAGPPRCGRAEPERPAYGGAGEECCPPCGTCVVAAA